jgi:hypothetical protein
MRRTATIGCATCASRDAGSVLLGVFGCWRSNCESGVKPPHSKLHAEGAGLDGLAGNLSRGVFQCVDNARQIVFVGLR